MVRRNRTVPVSGSVDRISAAAYSLNSDGQPATSLVMSQTRSIGAAITIALSVRPAMSRLRPLVELLRHGVLRLGPVRVVGPHVLRQLAVDLLVQRVRA